MDRKKLTELRSLEAHEDYQREVRARLTELNTEFAGVTFPEEARGEYTELTEEDKQLSRAVKELKLRQRHAEELATDPANHERGIPEWEREAGDSPRSGTRDLYDLSDLRVDMMNPESGTRQLRERALAAVEKESFPGAPDEDRARANVARLLETVDSERGILARRILATGSPLYKRAWVKALGLKPLTTEEARALSTFGGGGDEGGFAVPFTLDPTVILSSDGATNPLRAIARVETITTNEWRGITSDGVVVTRGSEGDPASDDAPTLAQPTVNPQRVTAFIPFSYEIGMDWGGLQAEIARMLQDGKDVEEADSLVNGDGTPPAPEGVVAGLPGGSTVDTATGGTFVIDDLYTLKGALPHRFRGRARFMAEDSIYDQVRQFGDASNNTYWVDLGGGNPAQLMGKPAHESSAMDAAVANGNLILLYGDFANYLIVDRVGMSVELIPHLFDQATGRPTGQRGFYAFWRNGAGILVENAFRVLRVKT